MRFLDERAAHDGDVARSHKNDDGWYILKTSLGWCTSISILVATSAERKAPNTPGGFPQLKGAHGGYFPCFFGVVGFRDSTREIPVHHAKLNVTQPRTAELAI